MEMIVSKYDVQTPTALYFIEYTGRGWAIRTSKLCFNKEANLFEWEPSPSYRDEDFFKKCRFENPEEAFSRLKKWYESKDPNASEDEMAKAHAQSEGDNGNAEISFRAGYTAKNEEVEKLREELDNANAMLKKVLEESECGDCIEIGIKMEKMFVEKLASLRAANKILMDGLENAKLDLNDLDTSLMVDYKIVISGFSRAKLAIQIAIAQAKKIIEGGKGG